MGCCQTKNSSRRIPQIEAQHKIDKDLKLKEEQCLDLDLTDLFPLKRRSINEASSLFRGMINKEPNFRNSFQKLFKDSDLKNVLLEEYKTKGDRDYNEENYSSSLLNYKQYSNIVVTEYGRKSFEYAVALDNLILVYQAQEKYDKALQLINQIFSIQQQFLGIHSLQIASTLNYKGLLETNLDKKKQALSSFQRAIVIFEKNKETKVIQYAQANNNAGDIYFIAEEHLKASVCFQKAIPIYKQDEQHQVQHEAAFRKLAKCYKNMGQIQKFLQMARMTNSTTIRDSTVPFLT